MARSRPRILIFPIHRGLAEFRLEEVASFIAQSRKGMEATLREFSEQFDKTVAGWSSEEVSEYVDHIHDDIAKVRDESPQLLRHAQCMIVYGTFENILADLCRALHRDGKIVAAPPAKLYMNDSKGYLTPHLRKRPEPFAKQWQWLDEFRIIRNWMAHKGGRAEQNNNWATAQKFLARNRGLIQFTHLKDIIVEDEFVDRALLMVKEAIDRINRSVQLLYSRAGRRRRGTVGLSI